MAETKDKPKPPDPLPKATVKKSRSSWLLWFFPLAAAAFCGWLLVRDHFLAGPTITIFFGSVDGLRAEDTAVMYRGARVGTVQKITLDKDLQHVTVEADLDRTAEDLARVGSVFWIVRPEVKIGSIRGLRTIVSGYYITVRPGQGARTNVFTGAEGEPIDRTTDEALEITFLAPELGSLQEESPIYYRGIQVGKVLYYQLGEDAQQVVIHARIEAQYAPLVRTDSKFWNAGGLRFNFGLFSGAEISAESPKTLISGGIAFATPTHPGEPATDGLVFRLYQSPQEEWQRWTPAIELDLPERATEPRLPAYAFPQSTVPGATKSTE